MPRSVTSIDGEFVRGRKVLFSSWLGVGLGISPIPFMTIGHLTTSLEAEFGWSRADTMFSITVVGLTNALMTPVYGSLIDRFGVRPVALWSLALFGIAWACVAFTPASLLVFYSLWFVMSLVGAGSQPISWTRAVNAWFSKRRGLALGLVLTGTGFSGVLINMLAGAAVEEFGWRAAVLATAALPLTIALPVAWFWFRDGPAAGVGSAGAGEAEGITFREAIKTPTFWILSCSFLAIALAFSGLYTNFVPMLLGKGFTAVEAGAITGLIGVSLIVGRIGAGYLFDYVWAPWISAPLLIGPVFACLLLQEPSLSWAAVVISAVLIGVAAGVESDLIAYLVAKLFGLKSYGAIYGALFGAFGVGSAISPPMYGWVYDVSGSYDLALYIGGFLFAAGGLLLLLLRVPETSKPEPIITS